MSVWKSRHSDGRHFREDGPRGYPSSEATVKKVGRVAKPADKRHHRSLYTVRRCKACNIPFILGPLDPDVDYCPLHAYLILRNVKKG
jgi:hypothetical protein